MEIKIVKGSVVEASVDAIVNAANSKLYPGGGVCGAIFSAAGYIELYNECKAIGGCPTGQAVITKGYNLKAKHIIHAVGPIYTGIEDDAINLASAYRSILELAEKHNLKSVALIPISVGIYRYPLEEAANIAINEILSFNFKSIKECYIYCYLEKEYDAFSKAYQSKK